MSRRNNVLTESDNEKMLKFSKSYVTSYDEALKIFLNDCELRNLREHTIKYYRSELSVAYKYLRDQEIDSNPTLITEEHIKEFIIKYMRRKGLKVVTINTRLRAIRAFFNFLFDQGYISKNPVKNMKLLKDQRTIINTFTRKQLKDLLAQPDLRTFTGIRDYTIMMILLDTGIRANELVHTDITDVSFEDSTLKVRRAKGRSQRVVPISGEMKKQLKKYLAIRGYVEEDSLFLTIDNKRITKRAMQQMLIKYGSKAKIKDVRCSPHTFRHTFAKLSVQNGAGIFELQQILGHSSLEIVRVYVNLFSNDVKDKHRKFTPLNLLM
ncbi:tyrosine-type recombinase/integrase [Metabacillus indicus]|uniref:tyrosine-type recombinase/integrase n=1 Tax=Metabacillus indicus TaxID=246786 RepID=UPI0024928DB2|nr:tyrosine-type recombinase/integrase [Metabacillus indicus]